MKHNYSAWRYLDPAPTDTKGAIIELIEKNHKETSTQIEAVKTANEKALTDKIKEVKDDFEQRATEAKALAQKTAEQLTAFEQKAATTGFGGNGGGQKSFGQQVEEKLTSHKSDLPTSVGKKFSFEVNTKAVGNMGSSANLTGSYFVQPTVVPGVILQPYNQTHMRDVLNVGQTDSNVIRYVRDNGGEGGPAMTAEAATKPQMDRDLAIIDANVRKLATYLRVPEEMIEDIPYLTSFLTNVGTQEVMAVEDTQIIYGDGTGQNLSGIANSGNFTAYAAGTSVVDTPNNYDVLASAVKQMRVLKRMPSVHLVSPVDYFAMISTKDSTHNYILQGGGNGLIPATAGGVPIVQMNQVATGDFITLDKNAAQIFFRSNINVRFYEQDQDNAIKNLVTIVIEERLALAIYYVTGIIKGTFAAAITDLTS
jgi:HK97 family phage major capsid protein